MAQLLVFGSINLDLGIPVPRLPALGETLLGDDALRTAALRLLSEAGVDLAGVRVLPGLSTGLASIAVTPDGDNAIVVAPGANAMLRADWVPDAALQAARLVLLQMRCRSKSRCSWRGAPSGSAARWC